MSEADVTEAFLAAPPLIAKEIYNLSVRTPRWLMDLIPIEEFPRGNGTEEQQLILRGEMPPIERGFDKWNLLGNNTGCNPCEGPNCGYNWTDFGGTGIERKLMQLMDRDFRSQPYCVKQVQTTAHFKQIMAQIVKNLYAQITFFKEQNIYFNYLTMIAKKFVVDSAGAKPNPQNPYNYRPIGTARISNLNIELLEFFYEYFRVMPDAIPFDVVDGNPIFAMSCSRQLAARLFRDDPQLRQDTRFSGLANDLLMKYNFMSVIRGMFINAPILFPRRFRYDGDNDIWIEVLPFVNGIPMEIGSFTGVNPLWVDPSYATHEEVLLYGKSPFKLKYLPTETTVGENTSFGPEFNFMNSWAWVNPQTMSDPMRRVGQFVTSATIGLAPQYSEAIFGVLVERPQVGLMAMWNPVPSCPPTDPDCDNEVPDVLCPCPLITSATTSPVTGNTTIVLAVPLDPVPAPDTSITLSLNTGGSITGNIEAINAEGNALEVSFSGDPDFSNCDIFTTVYCSNTCLCEASVKSYEVNCSDSTRLDLYISNCLKATSGNLTITYGNGDTATVAFVSYDAVTGKLIVDVGSSAFCDQVGGVVSICVPTANVASCPGCGGPTYTQCET